MKRNLISKALMLACAMSLTAMSCDAESAYFRKPTQSVNSDMLVRLPEYSCVNYEQASLVFPAGRRAHDIFNAKLDSLVRFRKNSVRFWHVGGSHVQGDMFSHRLRSNLTKMAPDLISTRGVLFPFAMAKTNFDRNYRMSYTGTWTAQRNVQRNVTYRLGLTGIAAQTTDTVDAEATVTLNLNVGKSPSWTMDRLRVMGYASSADVKVFTVLKFEKFHATLRDTIWSKYDSETESYVVPLPQNTDSATIVISTPKNESFTLTGLIPESDEPGIQYFSSGINGAAVPSWLKCEDLARDLKLVRPDIVFFAIGVNDAAVAPDKFDVEAFKDGYRRIIKMVRNVNPDAAFVFITNNDTYRKVSKKSKVANVNAFAVEEAFMKLAEEYDGAVWNVFDFMGRLRSSTKWRDAGLMNKDLIHFTRKGYELLGDMLFNALIEDCVNSKQ
ncbi:MAG: hypothetical protein ILP23_06960 [Paludibacteraceae bacterium]|nr:hypothetical protein [Paludibacteraceae bacterium]